MPSLFSDAPLSLRGFLWARSLLTPYARIAAALPTNGRILDLGSGHGLLSFALVAGGPERRVIGIDHDAARVKLAESAALRIPEASRPVFESGDLRQKLESFESASLAGVAMIDILHYFDSGSQERLISEASRVLVPGGVLAMREVDTDAGLPAVANRAYERLATGVGFTRSTNAKLTFRGARQWKELLDDRGFLVSHERCGPPFFADVLFTGRRR